MLRSCYETLAGHDPADSTSVNSRARTTTKHLQMSIKGLRVGVPKEYFVPGMDPWSIKVARNAIGESGETGA